MAVKKIKSLRTYRTKVDKRLKTLTPRQSLVLIAMAGVLFLLLGLTLGSFLATRQPLSSNGSDSSTPPTPTTQSVTRTGVVRQFKDSQHEGIDFYLEKGDGTRILLKSSGIDLDFFEGTSVTIEGTMTTIGDDSVEVLQVKKVWIKSS